MACLVRCKQDGKVMDLHQRLSEVCTWREHRQKQKQQLWDIEEGPEGYVKLISGATGGALQVSEPLKNGVHLVAVAPQSETDSQLWQIEGNYDDCMLRNKKTGKVLDAWRGKSDYFPPSHHTIYCKEKQSVVSCYPFHGGQNQKWSLETQLVDQKVIDISYDTLNKQVNSSDLPNSPLRSYVTNETNMELTQKVTRNLERSEKKSHTYESSTTHKILWKMKASVKSPGTSISFSCGGEHSSTEGESHSETKETKETVAIEQLVICPPHSVMEVSFMPRISVEEIPFKKTVQGRLPETGEIKQIILSGKYKVECCDYHVTVKRAK